MNFIDGFALSLSRSIRNNYEHAASEKVLFYALSLLLNSLFACMTVLIISAITGHFLRAIAAILFYTVLRYVSGGVHMSTSLRCCIFSIIIFTFFAHVNFSYNTLHLGALFNVIAALILLKTAPQGIENISRIDPKFYPLLKIISILIVILNLFFQSSMLAVAAITQAILTTKIGYQFIAVIESGLNYINGKEEPRYES